MSLLEPILLDRKLLDWLADPSDPALRAKVLKDLLEYPDDDPDLQAAKRLLPEQQWIKATLAGYNGDGTWEKRLYQKYRGTSWVMLHLSEIGAPEELPQIQGGVEYLLSNAKPISEVKGIERERYSQCTNGVYWHYPIACLTAHIATVLARYGHASQPITRAALATCRYLLDPEEGFRCFVIDQSLLPQCMMTVPKVLKAFLAIPKNLRTSEDMNFIQQLVRLLKKFHLYKYSAKDTVQWREWSMKSTSEERRSQKSHWREQGQVEPRKEKAGWLRFSFPLSYNSDLLEVLLLIGEVEPEVDEVITEGLSLLLEKRGKDGRWKMIGGLNGKMWANLDEKGKPSPWITYRALLALKQFGMLKTA